MEIRVWNVDPVQVLSRRTPYLSRFPYQYPMKGKYGCTQGQNIGRQLKCTAHSHGVISYEFGYESEQRSQKKLLKLSYSLMVSFMKVTVDMFKRNLFDSTAEYSATSSHFRETITLWNFSLQHCIGFFISERFLERLFTPRILSALQITLVLSDPISSINPPTSWKKPSKVERDGSDALKLHESQCCYGVRVDFYLIVGVSTSSPRSSWSLHLGYGVPASWSGLS